MSKFDDIIKKAVEGYEAPYSPSAWDAMNEQLGGNQSFEDAIKDAVESYKAPYDAAAWMAVSNELSNAQFAENIKDSVDNFEAPVDAAAWTAISGELDNMDFDKNIKESVENYEAAHDPSVWESISAQLGTSYTTLKWIGGTAAVAALLIGGFYFTSDNNTVEDDQQTVSTEEGNTTIAENNGGDINSNQVSNGDFESDNNDLIAADEAIGENIADEAEDNTIEESITDETVEASDVDGDGDDQREITHIEGNEQDDPNEVEVNEVSIDEPILPDNNNDEDRNYLANFSISQIESCAGETITFSADNPKQKCSYVWEFSDGYTTTGTEVERTFEESGSVDVALTLKDEREETTLASNSSEIIVNPSPKAEFEWEKFNGTIPTIKFTNKTDLNSVVWNIKGEKSVTNINEFEHTFRKKGNYLVQMTVQNEYGCSSTDREKIKIESDYNLLAPTALKPTAASADARVFIPKALLVQDREFTMTIYGKGGGMVYQTQSANEPWDGRDMKDNAMAPGGAYVWVVQLKNANGETETYQGQVILLTR